MSWSRRVPEESPPEREAEDIKARVSWLYFMEGMTQDAVASKLGLTRQRVLKLLAVARQDGTVQVRVTARLSECVALERRIETGLGVERCIVIPTPEDEAQLTGLLGAALGAHVSDTLRDGMTVGLGWGATLQASLTHIHVRPLRDLAVVSLLGGLTRASGLNPAECAWRFADLLGAESFLLTAPVFAPSEDTRAALRQHPGIAEVFARAERLDMALLSVGNLAPNATLVRHGLIPREDLAELRRAGAVGDVLCHFIDASGALVDHPMNRWVLAVDPASLRQTPNVVLAAGGWQKVEAIRAALLVARPNVLITDQTAAEGLLADAAGPL